MNDLPDILASRLNFDVVLYRGHTRQEMMMIALITLTISILFFGLLTQFILGMFLIGLGFSFPMSIPIGWTLAVIFQQLKAGKPKGYVKQQYLIGLDQRQLYQSPFIRYSGHWIVRRAFL